jgi:hypothetical protein
MTIHQVTSAFWRKREAFFLGHGYQLGQLDFCGENETYVSKLNSIPFVGLPLTSTPP